MSAPSPRPSAFLGIGNELLGELRIAFCALAVNIVENNRLAETWRFREPHIARNHAFEDLRSKEAAQIRCYLARERSPLVIHGKQDSFDFEAGIERAPDAHQGIQQLGNALQCKVFTLNRN